MFCCHVTHLDELDAYGQPNLASVELYAIKSREGEFKEKIQDSTTHALQHCSCLRAASHLGRFLSILQLTMLELVPGKCTTPGFAPNGRTSAFTGLYETMQYAVIFAPLLGTTWPHTASCHSRSIHSFISRVWAGR